MGYSVLDLFSILVSKVLRNMMLTMRRDEIMTTRAGKALGNAAVCVFYDFQRKITNGICRPFNVLVL